ncbi:hypothetical protein B0H13DRAFT_2464732, partial [Mycena leptocephala]
MVPGSGRIHPLQHSERTSPSAASSSTSTPAHVHGAMYGYSRSWGAGRGFARHREVKPLAPTRVPRQNAPHSSPVSDLTNPSLSPLSAPTDPRPRGCARLNTLGSAPTRPFPKSELWEGKEGCEAERDASRRTRGREGEGIRGGKGWSRRIGAYHPPSTSTPSRCT